MNAGRPAPRHTMPPRCRWCAAPVRLLESCVGWSWVHVGAGYSCRGAGRAILPTHAEPEPAHPDGSRADDDTVRLTLRPASPVRVARFVGP